MRVAIDGIPLLTPKTGIGKYTFELVNAFKNLPDAPDTRFLYGIHGIRRLRGYLRRDRISIPNVNGKNEKKMRWIPESIKAYIKKRYIKYELNSFKPDIFHATNYVADNFDLPVVVTIHDLAFIRYPQTLPKERLAWLSEGLPRTLSHARHIISDSQFTKQELISAFNLDEDRIEVIYPGVDRTFRPRDGKDLISVLNEFALTPHGYILSVGTLEPRKNILRLLLAYEKLPEKLKTECPLVVVGLRESEDQEISRLMDRIKRRGMLRALGYVPDDILPSIYAGAAVFVYPSIYEGFGFPPLEAMASGVPVIVSNRSSLPEIVGEAGIFIEPEDTIRMSQAIETLLEDPLRRQELSTKGLNRAKEFTWRACAERTFNIYKNVIEQY